MKKFILTLITLVALNPVLARSSEDPIVLEKEFIEIVQMETKIITNFLKFNDIDLINSLFDGSYVGSFKEMDELMAFQILGFDDYQKYSDYVELLESNYSNLLKKYSSHSERDLFSLIENKILLNLVGPDYSHCRTASSYCHGSCPGGGGAGAILSGLCHAQCMINSTRCRLSATLTYLADND